MPQNKPYRCGACDKQFATAADLMTHLQICRAAILGRAFLNTLSKAAKPGRHK